MQDYKRYTILYNLYDETRVALQLAFVMSSGKFNMAHYDSSLQEMEEAPPDTVMEWLEHSAESTWSKFQSLQGVKRKHTNHHGWHFELEVGQMGETLNIRDKDSPLHF